MNIEIGWVGVSVILAIIGHAYYTVRWATTMTVTLSSLRESLEKMDKELEKRDTQIKAMWNKLDHVSDRLTVVETKCAITKLGEHHGQ